MSNDSSKAPQPLKHEEVKAKSASKDQAVKTNGVPTVKWAWWLGLIYAIVLYVVVQYVVYFIFVLAGQIFGKSEARPASEVVGGSTLAQFVFMLMYSGLFVLGIWAFMRQYGQNLRTIGFKKPTWMDPVYGLAAVPVYFLFYFLTVLLATNLFPSLDINQQQQIGFDSVHGGADLLLAFISLVILPPITEEIVFRGFLFGSFRKVLPMVYAGIITSLIFAVAHLPEGGSGGPLYIAAIDTFVLSMILVYLREKTGSLWASITLHGAKNFIAFVALFALHFR